MVRERGRKGERRKYIERRREGREWATNGRGGKPQCKGKGCGGEAGRGRRGKGRVLEEAGLSSVAGGRGVVATGRTRSHLAQTVWKINRDPHRSRGLNHIILF